MSLFDIRACHNALYYCFFFNDTPTPEISTLSLHDALPISARGSRPSPPLARPRSPSRRRASRSGYAPAVRPAGRGCRLRSEEHTSELQSRQYLVCRLLLEKKTSKSNEHCPLIGKISGTTYP